jgi:hypothetical protein
MAFTMISVWELVIATAPLRKQIAMAVLPVPSDHAGGDCRTNEIAATKLSPCLAFRCLPGGQRLFCLPAP